MQLKYFQLPENIHKPTYDLIGITLYTFSGALEKLRKAYILVSFENVSRKFNFY
jgi:hypothetical protein